MEDCGTALCSYRLGYGLTGALVPTREHQKTGRRQTPTIEFIIRTQTRRGRGSVYTGTRKSFGQRQEEADTRK
ncbi:hypothetical protein F7725_028953 [Dissostichus mawsoni]|uniref:Uncharacterized protein n=1 Tax=Dissostichus mawsoni TaxID=36200 RepID=A0A7J5XH41_DISMA|nr:hypothetical protein F7725_028953 [Dissostichus mawsoni]